MKYVAKKLNGIIGVRFINHDDFNPNIDYTNDYIIDYQKMISENKNLLSFFENKYGIKLVDIDEVHFLSEYYYLFYCVDGEEENMINKISNDNIVEHCSLIDKRIIKINNEVKNIISDLEPLSTLEMESLHEIDIINILNNTIKKLSELKTYNTN